MKFNNNYGFLIPYFIFLMICILLLIKINQGDALLFFSESRTTFFNSFFVQGTKLAEEFIYAILTILAFVFISIRLSIMIPVCGFSVMGISYFLKDFFSHHRPKRHYDLTGWPENVNLIDGVELLNGDSSFPSGHTMSAFTLYFLLSTIFKNKSWGILCFTLALIVGLSRIYLFQHFLKDVFFGAILAIPTAYLILFIFNNVGKKENSILNKKLLDFFKTKPSV